MNGSNASFRHPVRLVYGIIAVTVLVTVTVPSVVYGVVPFYQNAAARRVAFDAATLKDNVSGDPGFMLAPLSRGTFTISNMSLLMIICATYRVQNAQVIGGPDWLRTKRYDISAKTFETATRDDVSEMLKTLLAEKFKLVLRSETKELPIYALVVSEKGGKLRRPEDGVCGEPLKNGKPCANVGVLQNGLIATNQPLSSITTWLGRIFGDRMVVDRTGLAGNFDIAFTWVLEKPTRSGSGAAQVDLPAAFTALEDQAGLRLESDKGPVPLLIVEGAQLPETESPGR